jgi:electron transport complex protein RnfD
MCLVCLCAVLALVQSSLTDSFNSLNIALVAVLSAIFTEFLILLKTHRQGELKDGSAAASALVFSLLLPNQIHPVYAVMGAVFAMVVVKHSFGGLGANWMNPALGGWLFVRLSWSGVFEKALDNSLLSVLDAGFGDGIAAAQGSPLGILKLISPPGFLAFGSYLDSTLRNFLNNTVFSLTGTELPSAYIDLLGSPFPGIIADRGLGALLLGTLIIAASQANRMLIPVVYLGVYGFFIYLFGALPYGGGMGEGDILFGFFTGGTMAAAFLLAADPAASPKSWGGIILSSVLAASLSYVFRYPGAEPYGAFFAVLFLNALLPLIRDFESRRLYNKGRSP